MSGTQPGMASAAAKQQNQWALNLQLRKAFTSSSLYVKKTLPSLVLAVGTTQYAIPLNNQGALVGIDLEFVLNLTNGATISNAAIGFPYNLISNYNFVDQSNVTRHNISGLAMFDYLNFRQDSGGIFYDANVAPQNGGGTYGSIAYPSTATAIAANAPDR